MLSGTPTQRTCKPWHTIVLAYPHALGLGLARPISFSRTGILDSSMLTTKELFPFLSARLVKQDLDGSLLLSTNKESVLSNNMTCLVLSWYQDNSSSYPCSTAPPPGCLGAHRWHWCGHPGHSLCKLSQLLLSLDQVRPSSYLVLPLFHEVTGCDTVIFWGEVI